MAETKEVTVRMSAKLFNKIGRLADQAYESPDTFIESALAHMVRQISEHQREMRLMESVEIVETSDLPQTNGYL